MGFPQLNISAIHTESNYRQWQEIFHHKAINIVLQILKSAESLFNYSDINKVRPDSSTITQQFNLQVRAAN